MASLSLRLDDSTHEQLEQLARARDTTVSELLRTAVHQLLGNSVDMPRAEVPRSLDMVQRRILALLHAILSCSSPGDDAEAHRRRIRVLEGGFSTEYHDEFFTIEHEMSPSECGLVMDILDMFTVLEASVRQLSESARAELGDDASSALAFQGFDGNDPRESRLLRYTEYLITDKDRWSTLAHHFRDSRHEGNSHMPTLDIYQRMLTAYRAVETRRRASRRGRGPAYSLYDTAELREVLDAIRRK